MSEYRIHDVKSRFRFWTGSGQPQSGNPIPTVTPHLTNTAYEAADCFSSMEFTASQLGDQARRPAHRRIAHGPLCRAPAH